ncbi:MAG: hypothetical protein HOK67_34555 [Deltaproteobacteria bacterium]|nr:hypothetical protein [Deltaproteobacteria bacterium]
MLFLRNRMGWVVGLAIGSMGMDTLLTISNPLPPGTVFPNQHHLQKIAIYEWFPTRSRHSPAYDIRQVHVSHWLDG